jgi:hypothetical protein
MRGESMREQLQAHFWVEGVLALVSASLALATLVWRDWLEIVFRIDPDRHSGTAEWAVAVVCATIALACAALARRSFLRTRMAHHGSA